MKLALLLMASVVSLPVGAREPDGILKVTVTDASGAAVPGVAIAAGDATGTTGETGACTIAGLAPGSYTVRANASGFAEYEKRPVEIAAGRTTTLAISLRLAVTKQQVTVRGEAGPAVGTSLAENRGAIVLRAEELDALSNDPDELAAELQALAGPGAGPNGGQLYVDGFTGARLPPKSSIREIRINQNPLSAEFDRLGYGRIEILTKPGTDKFHGESYFDFGDSALNSRNPYSTVRAPFRQELYGGNLAGPLNRRGSFFVDLERRQIDDVAQVNATVLDSSTLQPALFRQPVATPNRLTDISPRIDYQLSQNHTFVGRYRFTDISQANAGTSAIQLPSRAYDSALQEHVLQLTETAVLNTRAVNETRFQFAHTGNRKSAIDSEPALNVLGAFSGGGAQMGLARNIQNRYELQNCSTVVAGTHSLRIGMRLRGVGEEDISPQNFGGSFTFSGGGLAAPLDAAGNVSPGPDVPVDSLERYRRTLLLSRRELAPAQIRALGGGASLFTMAAGDPQVRVSQWDAAVFVQEEWRVQPNFTLGAGLRYEVQTQMGGPADLAPRIGFAWAPGHGAARKTVLRGGFGIFYSRLGDSLAMQARRFDGLMERQYIVTDPDFFPAVPAAGSIGGAQSTTAVWRVDDGARAPYVTQSVISLERQLPWRTLAATTVTWSRGERILYTRDINAPLPASGVRPYAGGDIFQYATGGLMRQVNWMTNMSSHIRPWFALFAMYGYVVTRDNTDGGFPSNQYDLSVDYGTSHFGYLHHFEAGGSFTLRGVRFSPLFDGHSGVPVNITSGQDSTGAGLYTDRPAFAWDASRPGVVATPYGPLDPNPGAGDPRIPRNYAEGPGLLNMGMRISRTFNFGGGRRNRAKPGPAANTVNDNYLSVFGDSQPERRYGLTISASARNLLNGVNANRPVGVLTSPLFLKSTGLAWNFGPAGESANRRIELRVRFTF